MSIIQYLLQEGISTIASAPLISGRYLLPGVYFMMGISLITAAQPSAREIRGPAAITPLMAEPAAKLIVDAPLPDQLAQGRVVVQYRTENLRILPVYGPAALAISPRVGHLHITVNDGPWRWVDASNEPIIINKLPAGTHRILLELADPTHKILDRKTISFIVPSLSQALPPG